MVIDFPSLDHARAFYRDADYAPFIERRQRGSDLEMVLVEGL